MVEECWNFVIVEFLFDHRLNIDNRHNKWEFLWIIRETRSSHTLIMWVIVSYLFCQIKIIDSVVVVSFIDVWSWGKVLDHIVLGRGYASGLLLHHSSFMSQHYCLTQFRLITNIHKAGLRHYNFDQHHVHSYILKVMSL